ncbi:nucleotidyltransferase family protein [Brevibacillus sp. FIR094]|uniref:nucleotidyltransferase family protein n=1 Tax=Brevibacillus sp. FIR094 TaxID=3134809 RepID=UPI003D214DC3
MKPNKIVGIYLAAGKSTRMGSDKLRLPLGSMKLGNYALAAALRSELDDVVIVSGDPTADWIDRTFYQGPSHRKWTVIHCWESHLGQSHSLCCGIAAAQAMNAAAVMILLADQPLITTAMINELLIHYQATTNVGFVASRHDGLSRPPVIFARRMFPDLLRLEYDQGARKLIRESTLGVSIDFTSADLFTDVDTVEDYSHLVKRWKS